MLDADISSEKIFTQEFWHVSMSGSALMYSQSELIS